MSDHNDKVVSMEERKSQQRRVEADVKQDGMLWSVTDMLQDSLNETKTRTILKGVFVYMFERPDGTLGLGFAQAGMTRAEEVAFLSLATQNAIDDWRA